MFALPLCFSLAGGADFPIGVSFADETATPSHLLASDVAGAEVQHANWNSCWRWGNPTALKNADGVTTKVTIKWDATGAWRTVTTPAADGNAKLMNAYLDSSGAANTSTFDGVFGSGDDKPVVLATKLDEWMAENNLTSYSVVIYSDGDSTGGDRATEVWLANTLPGAPVANGDPGLGSDLTTRIRIRDSANFGTTNQFVRVNGPTPEGVGTVGNYTVFSGLTAPSFYIRIDEKGSNPWRAPLNGFQIIGTNVVEVPDTDDDGLPDAWESNYGLDPNDDGSTDFDSGPEGDPDEDDRTNLEEYNGGVDSTNPRKADTDEDGLDDGEEFAAGTLPLDPDSDDDTLPDGWEADNGLDPLDDGTTEMDNGPDGDPDEDLLLNSDEFARKTNPNLGDTDGDGWDDLSEDGTGTWSSEFNTGSSPIKADTDGDGIKDGDENPDVDYAAGTTTGTDPNKSDTDGDGQNDRWEFLLGTDPTLDTSALATVSISNASFELPDAAGGYLRGIPDNWSLSAAFEIEETYVESLPGSNVTGGQGAQYAGIQEQGAYLYQTTAETFSPDTTYVVDLAGGYRNGFPTGVVEFGLFSSDAIGTPVAGYPGRMDLNGVILGSPNPDADGIYNKLRDASALTNIGSGALGRPFSFVTGSTPPSGNIVVYIRHASGFRVLFDNVRIIKVPNGIDADTDGLPDLWELANNLSPRDNGSTNVVNGAAGNRDEDGSPNSQELATGSDPNDYDTDNDGLSDGVETNTGTYVDAENTGTSPIKTDSDGDLLTDNAELSLGTDPNKADTDGDGFSDSEEILAGTDPVDPDDFPVTGEPKVASFGFNAGAFQLVVENLVASKTYTLAISTNLTDFTPTGATVTGVTTHTFSDAEPPDGAAFYRVQEVTPP